MKYNFFLWVVLLVFSCNQPELPVKISRMEQSLFNLSAGSIADSISSLELQYGKLFDLFCINIIRIGSPERQGFSDRLAGFITDPTMYSAYRRVQEVYPDLKNIESALGKAFFNYQKEFSDMPIPTVYTIISGFNESIITSDTIIAIALDNYLGRKEEMYFLLETDFYRQRLMDPQYLVPDCMKGWLLTEFPYNDSISNVLTNVLYEGKIMYALKQLLPHTPDSTLFGYSSEQMRWCQNNNAQMWTFLVDRKLLFSTDQLVINKLINPAPFCALFTRESPGRAAVWLGYKIVASYMKNTGTTTKELLLNEDYRYILDKARFNP